MTRATNSEFMKENNKKHILRLIMKGEYSRADIAKITGLTKAAISIITENLFQNNIILEHDLDHSGVGRRPKILSINKNRYFVVGVNITRTNYEVGVQNLYGDILISEKKQLYANRPPEETFDDIHTMVVSQLKAIDVSYANLLGIGITAPGPVDYQHGCVLTPPDFETWHYADVHYLKNKFDQDINIKIENVANAHALYEMYYGHCVQSNNYLIVLVADDGIGAGLVVGGSLYRGSAGLGSEFGHITIDLNGKICKCGNKGCLERYASISELLKGTPFSSWEEVVDKGAISVINRQVEYLSAGLTSAINMFDIDMVILTGAIGYKGEKLCKIIENKLSGMTITKNHISVVSTILKNTVTVAGSIIINDFFH